MRILIVTDAWLPQVNGVVRTLQFLTRELEALGHSVVLVTPEGHFTIPLPTYPEIRLALFARRRIAQAMDAFVPDTVHIATEGPLGWAARALCRARRLAFTTSFHTKYPQYIRARLPFVSELNVYRILCGFHRAAAGTMVATQTLRRELESFGFGRLRLWSRGVDVEMFHPRPKRLPLLSSLERPIFLYVGRVAVEKNLPAFLALDLPGSKVVVGSGPSLEELKSSFPHALFLGFRSGGELAALYAAADVFVFPSLTDTFGLVLIEALASGIPIAAFPLLGVMELVSSAPVAALSWDLRTACLAALDLSPDLCRDVSLRYSWRHSAEQFFANLVRTAAPKPAQRGAPVSSTFV